MKKTMKKTTKARSLFTIAMAMALGLTALTGCSHVSSAVADRISQVILPNESLAEADLSQTAAASAAADVSQAEGGVLFLSVNPEVAISYDADGLVTAVEARNDDGSKLLEGYTGYVGKPARQVVSELVTAIGEAGYFAEEIEGENRQIVIEVEKGSAIPDQEFLNEIVADVQGYVSTMQLTSDIDIEGATDYTATDYGPNADGATGYDDTDYGPNADGVTDYDDTDYGPNADGVTDYDDTDYGPNADGVTDYVEPAPAPSPVPAPSGDSSYGDTNYDDGGSDYDLEASDGDSNYDDGGSNYDDGGSDYDD